MNLTIDINTVILLCGLVVNAAVMLVAAKSTMNNITQRLHEHDREIADLYDKHGVLCRSVYQLEGRAKGSDR